MIKIPKKKSYLFCNFLNAHRTTLSNEKKNTPRQTVEWTVQMGGNMKEDRAGGRARPPNGPISGQAFIEGEKDRECPQETTGGTNRG